MKKTLMVTAIFVAWIFAAVSGTALSDLAASMQPGQWRELSTTGLSESFLRTSGDYCCHTNIVSYAAKAQWDPNSKQFLFFGSPHDNPYKFVIYSEASNAWRTGPLPDPCFNSGHYHGGCSVHSYYYSELDPVAGKFYFFSQLRQISEYTISTNTWRRMPGQLSSQSYYGGLARFPSRNGFLYVAGAAWWYSLATSRWAPFTGYGSATYHDFAVYNPVKNVVLCGGGNGNRKVWKLLATGGLTRVTDAPCPVGTNNGNVTYDPVSGKFLAYAGTGSMYEYDSDTDTWTALSTLPPSAIRAKFPLDIVAAPVSSHGVIMYLNNEPAMVHLYKHSAPTAVQQKAAPGSAAISVDVSPNPFHTGTRIRLDGNAGRAACKAKIYDARGRRVADLPASHVQGTMAEFVWDASNMAPGAYVLSVSAGNAAVQKRIVVLK